MKRCPPLFLLAVLLTLIATSALAQVQYGNIYGNVKAKDGSVLPGVTVTLTGVGAPQTAISDAQGNFRFLNLAPGTYTTRAELAGYGTVTRGGIGVRLGQNADVTMTLGPTVAESITVTAEAPILDTRKTGTGIDVSKVELDQVPTARDPWVILQQTPGVSVDRMNVGGNESGQQSVYVSRGASGAQSSWNVDGVTITDFAATGSSPTYYDFGSFEEMQITTAGSDPRIQTPGVQINMVTKRGTNDFKGSVHDFQSKKAWQATPRIPAEAQSYLATINQINGISEGEGEVGGPIWRDKVWLWGAYGKQDIDILTPTLLAGSRFRDRTTLKNENVKLNAQPLPSNSLTAVDQYGSKIKLGRNVSLARPPVTAWNQNDAFAHGTGSLKDPSLWKIEDTQIIGKNLYITGLYSKVQGGFQLIADNGKGCQSVACGLASDPAWYNEKAGSYERSYYSGHFIRPQSQYRLDGSAFFDTRSVNHELKFGFGYHKATVTSQTAWPGDQWTDNYAINGITINPKNPADTGVAVFPRFPVSTYFGRETSLYIGDTIMWGNLTIQPGVRYDMQKGGVGAGIAQANSNIPDIVQTVNFPAVPGPKWNNIAPRLGLTYTLGANRQTLLRANLNRYVNQLNSGSVTPVSPGAYARARYYFNDLNGDNIAQRNEIDFASGPIGSLPSNNAAVSRSRLDPNLKAPHTDEVLIGAEREVLRDFSVGVDLIYRKANDFVNYQYEKHQGAGDWYTSADYMLAPTITNITLPNGTATTANYYILKPGTAVPFYRMLTNVSDYYQSYKGLDLTATKRMSNRWMLRGNLTLQDWKQHVGPNAIITTGDPTRGQTCGVCNGAAVLVQSAGSGAKANDFINSKWSYNLTGVYTIPVIESSFGVNLSGRQGYAIPYVVSGRSTTGEGTKSVLVPAQVDTFRNQNVKDLDFRLAKDFRFYRSLGLTLSLDAFNVLNSNTILQRNAGALCSAAQATGLCTATTTANRVTEVLSPRVFRAGARLSF